jgi:Fe(3+) dicitrate transport protein
VQTLASGAVGPTGIFNNFTDAHAAYVDDRVAFGHWRVTPGVRFEHIASEREDIAGKGSFDTTNNKWLPSLNVAYLASPAWTLFANYGTSFGPVQNIQLNSQTATNPLKPELAKTEEVGTRWKDSRLSAELTAFHIRFDNQILQVPGVVPSTFQNIGATRHVGVESAIDYAFDPRGALAGFAVFANYTWTQALQESGATAGKDVPFYSRDTDTEGLRWARGAWSASVSTTHQSHEYSDNANTVAESANASVGRIPGFRLYSTEVSWASSGTPGFSLQGGINNLADKRYYTRNIDGNPGRMVGAPRTFFVQARVAFR